MNYASQKIQQCLRSTFPGTKLTHIEFITSKNEDILSSGRKPHPLLILSSSIYYSPIAMAPNLFRG